MVKKGLRQGGKQITGGGVGVGKGGVHPDCCARGTRKKRAEKARGGYNEVLPGQKGKNTAKDLTRTAAGDFYESVRMN